jgi:hypothetical protein
VVCREEEVTGSILGGRRICHTRREWDEMERQAKDTLDRARELQNIHAN